MRARQPKSASSLLSQLPDEPSNVLATFFAEYHTLNLKEANESFGVISFHTEVSPPHSFEQWPHFIFFWTVIKKVLDYSILKVHSRWQLKKLLCIFLTTRKINVVESISHIRGWKTGTMGSCEMQLREMPFPRGVRHSTELPSPTPLSPSAQRESTCCSTEVSQHHWRAPQWFVRPKHAIVSLSVICQSASSSNHTGQTSPEKGRVCYDPVLINIWVWLHWSHKLYSQILTSSLIYTQGWVSKHISLTQTKTQRWVRT